MHSVPHLMPFLCFLITVTKILNFIFVIMVSPAELVGIVLSLVDIFKIDFVLVCPEYDLEGMSADISKVQNWRIVPSGEEGLEMLNCGKDDIKCLLLCHDVLPWVFGQYRDSDAHSKDIIPFIPKSKIDLLANYSLKLEDTVLSFEERNNATTITEWYGLKGRLYFNYLFTKMLNKDISEKPKYIWERRSNLDGQTLILSLVEAKPQVIFDPASGDYDGLFVEVARLLQKRLNFKIQFVNPPDGLWGSLRNGSWNGLVRQLMEKEVDLSLDLAWIPSRFEMIDYSAVVYKDILTVILKNKESVRTSINMWVFIDVFPKIAWLLIILLIFTTSLLFAKVILNQRKSENFGLILCKQLISTMMHCIQQSNDETSKEENVKNILPFRMLFFVSNFTFFLLFTAYTSDLTASMTAGGASHGISSFQDIIDLDYTLIYSIGSMQESVLKNSEKTSPAMYMVYKKHSMGITDFNGNLEEALKSNNKYVAFDAISMYMNCAPLYHFQGARSTQVAFGLQKGSDLTGLISYHILNLHRTGVMSKLVFKWQEVSRPEDYSNRIFIPDALPLGYDNLVFLVIILVIGILLSCLMAILESI